MNADRTGAVGLDLQARAAHTASLDHLSARVQAQLALRRRDALAPRPTPRRAPAWPWATAAVAGVALAFVFQVRMPDHEAAPASGPAATATVAGPARVAALDTAPVADAMLAEDPDLYLWLASNEGRPYVE